MRRFTNTNYEEVPVVEDELDVAESPSREPSKKGYGPLASKVPRFIPVGSNTLNGKDLNANVTVKTLKQSFKPFGQSGKVYKYESSTPG